MNFLAHAYLAGDEPEALLGALLGDFVKGPLEGRHPARLHAGLLLHRRIDSYTDGHAEVAAARRLVSPARRRYAGVLLDLFFDHFLAARWDDWCDEPLPDFTRRVYALLEAHRAELPPRLAGMLPAMVQHDWLGSYREVAAVGVALERMGRRLRRGNALAGGEAELLDNYAALQARFAAFFPEVVAFAAQARR